MFDTYEFRQTLNGFIVIKNNSHSRDGFGGGLFPNEVWVFNDSQEMGQWVCDNFLPATPTNTDGE